MPNDDVAKEQEAVEVTPIPEEPPVALDDATDNDDLLDIFE